MKFRLLSLVAFALLASSAFAWNCSDPLASRVDVGTTNPGGSAGDGDGQYFLGTGSEGTKGHYYVCEVPKGGKTGGGSKSSSTSTATSTSSSNQNQGQQQGQQQGQTANGGSSSSTATGGNSTATGGNSSSKSGVNNSGNSSATGGAGGAGGAGGSVSGSGNSTNNIKTTVAPVITSTNKLSNSGNSSNTNTNTANGGSANGNGSDNTTSASSTNSNQSSASNQANGNGSNSNNTTNNSVVEAPKIPVNTAYAPTTIPTAPCLKGYSAGGQGAAFGFAIGGSKEDKNCQLIELARSFDSMNERLAGCKVKISSKLAKDAGVTLADCMAVELVAAPPIVAVPAPEKPQPIVVVVPQAPAAPVVTPVVTVPAAPAIAWESICTFASKTACSVPGSDALIVDPSRPTSVCKLMIDSAVRAFRSSPNSRFVLVGNRNRDESDLLPTARANNVRRLLENAGVPASSIAVQVGTGTTRTVEIVLIQAQ